MRCRPLPTRRRSPRKRGGARDEALPHRHGQGRRGKDHGVRGRGARARGEGQARPRVHVQREGAPLRDARLRAHRRRGHAGRAQRVGREHGSRARARRVRDDGAPLEDALQAALRQQVRAHLLPRRAGHAGVDAARQGLVAHDRDARRRQLARTTSSSSTRRRRATGSTCCACRRSSSTSCRRASSVATPSARGRCSRIPRSARSCS